jgi:GNAT superfamily N-acetyltransferase
MDCSARQQPSQHFMDRAAGPQAAADPLDRLRFHEITDRGDPLLTPWLDLYARAFPPDEKVPVSEHLDVLSARAENRRPDRHLLAAVDGSGKLIGMARYDVAVEAKAAYLMYLAIEEDRRGGGIGSTFYREILRRLCLEDPPLEALLFEVDRPDQAQVPERRTNAERRIRFYQRLGAHLLQGIHYVQTVPGQPPVPMHLMIHPLTAIDADQAFHLAAALFEISRTDEPLGLE